MCTPRRITGPDGGCCYCGDVVDPSEAFAAAGEKTAGKKSILFFSTRSPKSLRAAPSYIPLRAVLLVCRVEACLLGALSGTVCAYESFSRCSTGMLYNRGNGSDVNDGICSLWHLCTDSPFSLDGSYDRQRTYYIVTPVTPSIGFGLGLVCRSLGVCWLRVNHLRTIVLAAKSPYHCCVTQPRRRCTLCTHPFSLDTAARGSRPTQQQLKV